MSDLLPSDLVPAATTPRPVTPIGILADRLARIVERVEGLAAVGDDIKAELRASSELAGGLDPYLARCTTPESGSLRRLTELTRAQDWDGWADGAGPVPLEQEMLSGHLEGRLLAFLVRLSRARRVLEIGMFTGYSALAMAEALPEDGEVVACELDPAVADLARTFFAESAAGGRITVEVGPAQDTLRRLAALGTSFDLVFVDADKQGYAGYLETLLDTDLLAPGAVVCVDNTLLQGEPYAAATPSANGAAVAAFNQAVADDDRVEQVLLPVRDGLTLIRRV